MSGVLFTPDVCKIVNAKSHIHCTCSDQNSLDMSGKRGKKIDSEVNGIIFFFKLA